MYDITHRLDKTGSDITLILSLVGHFLLLSLQG